MLVPFPLQRAFLLLLQSNGGGSLFSSLLLLLISFIFFYVFTRQIKRIEKDTPDWHALIPNLNYSSMEFYRTVQEILEKSQVPSAVCTQVTYAEAGMFSENRVYLRVERRTLAFVICAAPFGTSFFVSHRQLPVDSLGRKCIRAIPFIGGALEGIFFPVTLYEIDTEIMFRTTIHDTVIQIVDAITKEKGSRGLTDIQRKPIGNSLN